MYTSGMEQDTLGCSFLVLNEFLATMVDLNLGNEEREESISFGRFHHELDIRVTGVKIIKCRIQVKSSKANGRTSSI